MPLNYDELMQRSTFHRIVAKELNECQKDEGRAIVGPLKVLVYEHHAKHLAYATMALRISSKGSAS